MGKEIIREELWGHPKGLYVLFFTEMWERFSYYGMRALLVLFLVADISDPDNPGFGWSEKEAYSLFGWYTMMVYVCAILGGILADKFIGRKKSVVLGGFILILGHSILAFPGMFTFYTGIILIILGVGALKPNISTIVGELYSANDKRRDEGFVIFYIGINAGAFLSGLIIGVIGETYGWHYGFGLAGIGMFFGQLVFMLGRKHLIGVGEKPNLEDDNSSSLGDLLSRLIKSGKGLGLTVSIATISSVLAYFYATGNDKIGYALLGTFYGVIGGVLFMIYREINKIEKDRFVVLLLCFFISIIFWGAFEQSGALINIYTNNKIDRTLSLWIIDLIFIGGGLWLLFSAIMRHIKKIDTSIIFYGLSALVFVIYGLLRTFEFTHPYEVKTTVFQSVNSFFIMIFGTASVSLWVWIRKKGWEYSAIFKMAVGTIILGIGFSFMTIAAKETVITENGLANVSWLILAYLFWTIGELFISPVTLSFVTKVAPVKYVSILMGVYFAITGLGNKLAGVIGEISTEMVESSVSEGVKIGLSEVEATANAHSALFMYILAGCIGFSMLIIVFLKKLKSLTHGAEELVDAD